MIICLVDTPAPQPRAIELILLGLEFLFLGASSENDFIEISQNITLGSHNFCLDSVP